MKYYIIAGEPSGDLHGSRLVKALKSEDPEADILAWGGDKMQREGAVVVKHIRDLAIMGIVQVIKRLPEISRNFNYCHQNILDFKPDAIILIDYSGFNLRVAKWSKKHGFKVFYYISPQVWATRSGRVKKIKKYVDRMFCILPFEKDFYHKFGYNADYVGHPLLDIVDEAASEGTFCENLSIQKPIVALLPGSRKQEVKTILRAMLSVVPDFPDYQFIIAGAPTLTEAFYQPFLKDNPNVNLVQGQTYPLLSLAHAALVTSGTATLETALFKVPQVVCYKTGPLFYWIVRQIIKIPFISLVNIIMGKKIVEELIQGDLNKERIKTELLKILDPVHRSILLQDYEQLRLMLGEKGAADRAGKMIVEALNENRNQKD